MTVGSGGGDGGADYPRDMIGYGPNPPDPRWPGGANIAVQFVLNYEEGGEHNVLHGDAESETFLSDVDWGAGISEPSHERGVAVRIRVAGRTLAGASGVRPARAAADDLRCRHGAGPESRGGRRVQRARRRDGLPRVALAQLPARRTRRRARAHGRGGPRHDRVDRGGASWAGTPAGTPRRPADSSSSTAASCTTPTPTPTTCRTGRASRARTIWWCRTRWTPTT